MRATAALLEQSGAPFVLTEVDLEEPRADEVLVRLSAVGICGTDLEFANFFPTPVVLGHEGAGVVEQVGSRVTSVKPGDHEGVPLPHKLQRLGQLLPAVTRSARSLLPEDLSATGFSKEVQLDVEALSHRTNTRTRLGLEIRHLGSGS